jgi:hypothetical protein
MSKKRTSSVRLPAVRLPPPATAANRSPKVLPDGGASVTEQDIARRAYELYEKRGCEHGYELDDWLQAERGLRNALRSTGF